MITEPTYDEQLLDLFKQRVNPTYRAQKLREKREQHAKSMTIGQLTQAMTGRGPTLKSKDDIKARFEGLPESTRSATMAALVDIAQDKGELPAEDEALLYEDGELRA